MSVFQDNRALLDAFRAGSREALGTVYYRYVDEVATLVRLGFHSDGENARTIPGVHSPDQQAELVQETFSRAFTESARLAYDGVRPYRPYLLRIAKNLLVDRVRKRPELSLDEAREVGGAAAEAAQTVVEGPLEETLHWQELTGHTRDFLAGLDAEAQTFVRLRFEEEQSQDDVAAAMKITRRRVRTLEQGVQEALVKHLKRIGKWPK